MIGDVSEAEEGGWTVSQGRVRPAPSTAQEFRTSQRDRAARVQQRRDPLYQYVHTEQPSRSAARPRF